MQLIWEVRVSLWSKSTTETYLFYTKEQAEKFMDHHMRNAKRSQLPQDIIYTVNQKPIHGKSFIEELESED